MKQRVQIALFATFLSIIAHLYLTFHYYPLKFGYAEGVSACTINSTFDCDAVSASAYSAVFDIPLSVLGLAFNSVLFILILLSWWEWTDTPERLRRITYGLTILSLGSSIVMGTISVFLLHNYCLFCIGLYVLSLITFLAYRGVLREPFWPGLRADIPQLWSQSRGILIFVLAIPVFAFLIHKMYLQNLGAPAITKFVNQALNDWDASPKHEFVAKPTLVTGPDNATMTLVEFADFRCSHCKAASYTLHAFVKANPDVRFEFYSWPLDGACNEKIDQNNGISCRLAGAVHCAEKDGKGWDMHKLLFDKQSDINAISSTAGIDIELAKIIVPLGLNWDSLQRCMDQPETMDAIKASAKQGGLVNVYATPTLFANGKLLAGRMVPVLQAVHSRLKNTKQ